MSDGYLIREEGERKHFAMIPNFIDDLKLSQAAYRLYGHIKRVAGERGHCVEGVDSMAKHCQMSKPTAIKAKRELETHELIRVKPGRDRTKPDELVILDVWGRNTEHFEAVKNEERGKYETPQAVKNEEREAVKNRERKKSSKEEYKERPQSIYSKVIEDSLSLLAELDGYPANKKENAKHLEKQCGKHPALDMRREVERFVNHYEEQGFTKGQKPRARLSTWLDNAQDWGRKNQQAEPMRRKKKRVSDEYPEAAL